MARKRRDDGYYTTSVKIRMADGAIKRKNIYGKTVKELEAKKAEYKAEFDKGLVHNGAETTFSELAEIWFTNYNPNLSTNTLASKRYRMDKHLVPVLGDFQVGDIQELHLQQILSRMAKDDASWDSVNKTRNMAVDIMRVAVKNQLVPFNVFADVKTPRNLKSEVRNGVDVEIADLITKSWHKHRLGIGAMVMLYCGLRRQEMVPLLWDDISLKDKTLRVNKAVEFIACQPNEKPTKSKAGERTLPIPDILADALLEHYKNGGKSSSVVCAGIDGKIMTLNKYRVGWTSYQNLLNLEAGGSYGTSKTPRIQAITPFTAHQLRHSYITELQRKMVPEWGVKMLAGHSLRKDVTMGYTHGSLDDLRRFIHMAFNSTDGYGKYPDYNG